MNEIRLLAKEDIDVRVAQTTSYTNNGVQVVKVSLLLYKDARVDMKILDELFTPLGWKRSHKLIGDRLYCCVEVWDTEKREWVSKEDVGVESNTEAEKGQASDSFKRACFNWGIGRELYTAPKISIELKDGEYDDRNGRLRVFASFKVGSIGYDAESRTITTLTIVDRFGNERFSFGTPADSRTFPEVKARRAAKTKPLSKGSLLEPDYTPVDREVYYGIVKAYAMGKPTKTGGDYRQTWIEMTHAREENIKVFDQDVEDYRKAQAF